MSSDDIAIEVHDLRKRYEIYPTPRDRLKQMLLPRLHRASQRIGGGRRSPAPQYFREFWALDGVSFQVRRGETFGIIGRNGSGKSTLLQILAGVLAPTSGHAVAAGRVAALLELGSGFDPEMTGRENVFLNGRILGLSQADIEARYDRIVAFADIGEFIDEPVKTYSSGMFLRLAFAVQAHIDATIVIIDEALAVGDVFFRQKCYLRLEQLKSQGAAILLVSHSMPDIEQHCDRALLLDHGLPIFVGPSSEAAKHYYLMHQAERVGLLQEADTRVVEDSIARVASSFTRPPAAAFLDLSDKRQIGISGVRCSAVALTNEIGEACFSFQQGMRAVFFVEYDVEGHSGVPLCGIVIKNDRGLIVHGKNAWQFDSDLPALKRALTRISCWHEIALDLAQGEYVFEVGLAIVTESQWRNRACISHEAMSASYVTACQVANVGTFSIGLKVRDGVSILTHHGIADLPGRIETHAALLTNSGIAASAVAMAGSGTNATIE
jgi:lipopolysaccharide transport system ATP-binding protein